MRLLTFEVSRYRSLENITISFPENKPVVLFGPNNVGKSNILKAMDCLLGEKHSSYIDFQDSDYFSRNKEEYPNISFSATFDENIKPSYPESDSLCFTTNHEFAHYKTHEQMCENTYHYTTGEQMFIKNEEREQCQFILVDATRDISRQLSYFSQYSVLSKMAKKMHSVVVGTVKQQLDEHFASLKETFELVPEYKKFLEKLYFSFESNADGFEHRLEIDLSAYDPNNYFSSLRIIAKEGENIRAFEEFGTGEQQILLMSFVKAYAETFKGETFILGIEEPEAHLHPIAQRWLAKNVNNISQGNIQVIISTHSPEFLDIENLDGFVKVYKEGSVTRTKQHDANSLTAACIELGANPSRTTAQNVLQFYKTNTFTDQLKGFFSRKIILVEGSSELFSLPNYFENCGYGLAKNGVEIIDCRGKSQIARNYRLFHSYGYEVFCLFDADSSNNEKQRGNQELDEIFGFGDQSMNTDPGTFTFDAENKYGYFGHDLESYLHINVEGYEEKEDFLEGSKPLKAKNLSEQNSNFKPGFIDEIASSLGLNTVVEPETSEEDQGEDIPF